MKTPSHIEIGGGSTKLLMLGILCLILVGCAPCPERTAIREGMDGMTQTIRKQHLEWAGDLVVDPATGKNHVEKLPTLTPEQYHQIVETHKEYNELVNEDRANDRMNPSSTQP